MKDLEDKGVKVLNSEEELETLDEGKVIIRSHGVPKNLRADSGKRTGMY